MSTLKVNTVQHNTSGFNNVVQFTDGGGTQNGTLCRAWVNFNGMGTVAIRADFNVNSITDTATGQQTINFSNAMSDANYSAIAMCTDSGSGPGGYGTRGAPDCSCPQNYVPTSSQIRLYTAVGGSSSGNGYAADYPHVWAAIFR